MNIEDLKMKAAVVASVDRELLSEFIGVDIVEQLLWCHVQTVRDLMPEISFTCISKHPTMIIQSPEKTLFVCGIKQDENGTITDFTTTCDPSKAYEFPMKWAQENARAFKNGHGSFSAIDKKKACVESLASNIEQFRNNVHAIIIAKKTKLKDLKQIQSSSYMGEFFKPQNHLLGL